MERPYLVTVANIDASITLPYWDWTLMDSRDLDIGVWKSFFGGRNNTAGAFDHWTYECNNSPGIWSLPTLDEVVVE